MCNIGATITAKNSDYYIFHDIDVLPKQETCNYDFEYYPTHLCPNLKPLGKAAVALEPILSKFWVAATPADVRDIGAMVNDAL